MIGFRLNHDWPKALFSGAGIRSRRGSWLLAFALASSALFLPYFSFAGPGTTSENFLKIGLAPRPVALGEAFTGLADDVNAIAYNPAGLAFLNRQEAAFMHNLYIQDVQQDYLGYVYPSAHLGSFGASVNQVRVSPFNSFDANDNPIGTISAQDMALSAAYALNWRNFALGINGKYLDSRLADVTAHGTAWDFGGLVAFNDRLRMGVAVQNLGPSVKFISEAFPLPLTAKIGASYLLPIERLNGFENARLLATADIGFPRDNSPYVSAGLEFTPIDFVALRVGYRGNQDAGTGFAIGAGIKLLHEGSNWMTPSGYPDWMPTLDFDYAFVAYGDLGVSHRLGIVSRFGNPKKKYHVTEEKREIYMESRTAPVVPQESKGAPYATPDILWIQ